VCVCVYPKSPVRNLDDRVTNDYEARLIESRAKFGAI